MYLAFMQSCGMKEPGMDIKTVGKSGQISLGKALAGSRFVMETLATGDILLKRAMVIPMNEQWLHEPAMREKLARADEWMRKNPPTQSDLSQLEAALGIVA